MRRSRRIVVLVMVALGGLVACHTSDLLNATVPREGYHVAYDMPYGNNPRQRFDIYTPVGAHKAPVIVFFYGGSWQMGDKAQYRFVGQALASKGYVAVIPDYRLYPEVTYPTFVEDGAASYQAARKIITSYGGDSNRMFLAGHSAGAYIALMLAAEKKFLPDREGLRGVIGISGPYDFLPFTDPDIKTIFSTAPEKDTQPINHITGRIPPVFLATGKHDETVLPRNSYRLAEKLEKKNNTVELHIYDEVEHIGIILSLAEGFRERSPLLEDIAKFVGKP